MPVSTDRPYKKMMSRYSVSTYHTRFRLIVTDRGDKALKLCDVNQKCKNKHSRLKS
jgi:hypothetical protein